MKKFIYCESTEGGMDVIEINSVKDLKQIDYWMDDAVKKYDRELRDWMKTAQIGDYFDHRLGVCFRVNLNLEP